MDAAIRLKKVIDSRKPRQNIEAYDPIQYIKSRVGSIEPVDTEPEEIFRAVPLEPVKRIKTNQEATRTVGNTSTNIVTAHEMQLLYSEGAINEAFSFKR
jgi:hypothetical protein